MKEKVSSIFLNRRWLASLLVIAVILTCAVVVLCSDSSYYLGYDSSVTGIDDGWADDDGQVYSLSELPNGEITLHHSTQGLELDNMRLCMKSVDTFFEVFADGQMIYSYRPEQSALLGQSYGMYIHAIPVPETAGTITLKMEAIFADSPPAILNAVIEDPGMFMGDIFNEGIPGFCVCLLMLILGVIMIVSGAFTVYGKNSGHHIEVFTLGIFAVLVAIWSVNDTLILQVLTQSPATVRLMNYITLIFLPYFIVSFIASATNKHKSPLLPILFGMICVNFILNISLTVTGVSDYFELVKISQGVIVVALAIAIYFVVSAVRHKQVEKRFLRTFIIGICAITVGAMVDLIKFRVTTNVLQETSLYARMGSLLFLMLIGLYLIRENRRIQIKNSRALARLAYTDGLTGLKNRLAFNDAESYLKKNPDAKYMIIQFDINDLKKVNDVYGHAEGDRHINGAAGIIRDSIGDAGECYRIGGDEFVAIVTGPDVEKVARHAIDKMEKLTEEYNAKNKPPVLLDIAYGMAEFTASDGDVEKSFRLADKKMYECKRVKKQKSAEA
ncbi:MAG: diguanylate cyclase [Eubacterium sp.]|nr:diguanylate cyclase [Eubacterium sp.]